MSAEGWAIIIGAAGLAIVQIITAWRGEARSNANRAATAAQLAPIATGVRVTEAHVNSQATRTQGEKDTLEKENAILREMIAKQDADKALLAQAVASRQSDVAGPTPPAAESLRNIDAATAETAENTRKKLEDNGR